MPTRSQRVAQPDGEGLFQSEEKFNSISAMVHEFEKVMKCELGIGRERNHGGKVIPTLLDAEDEN